MKIKIDGKTVVIHKNTWSCSCGASKTYGKHEFVAFACGHIYAAHLTLNKLSNDLAKKSPTK